MPNVPAGSSRSSLFSVPAAGRYIIAVDAVSPHAAGAFRLDVEKVSVTDNRLCGQAQMLTLVDGAAAVQGDTAASENDLGAHVFCGGPRLVGPQRYYAVKLEKRPYQVTLAATFDATLALGTSCTMLPIDCASSGLSGIVLAVGSQQKGVIAFTPGAPGTYILAVDSADGGVAGTFRLWVRALTPPTNGTCATPAPITLKQGHAEMVGDTGPLKNDLLGIRCGAPQGPFVGPQAYYYLTVPAGKRADVTLTPETRFDAAIYAFTAQTVCSAATVEAACVGHVSDRKGAGLSENLTLQNVGLTDQDYLLVVDSWSPSEVGTYLLEVDVK